MYAILSHGGRQYRVSAGDRLLVDRLDAAVGSIVALEPVLLTGGEGEAKLGRDIEGVRVAVTVVAHRRGEKLRIFKYKAKKRSRKIAGHRSDLTELRVESILAKGAAVPRAPAASAAATTEAAPGAAAAPARRAPSKRAAAPTSTKPKAAPKASAGADEAPAKRAPARATPRRSASKPAARKATGKDAGSGTKETGDGA